MSTTFSLPLAPAPRRTPADAAAGEVVLADLLAEVGVAIEPLPVDSLAPGTLATLTAHLVDGAGAVEALSPVLNPALAPSRPTAPIVSLRTLGVLAARTAGTVIAFPPARAAKVRTLLAELTA